MCHPHTSYGVDVYVLRNLGERGELVGNVRRQSSCPQEMALDHGR